MHDKMMTRKEFNKQIELSEKVTKEITQELEKLLASGIFTCKDLDDLFEKHNNNNYAKELKEKLKLL
ncbi:MAG: hypothetical protein HQ541_10095 [Mariniphaga sp.]|nr:hypothetical protein [Mariniphaga sp.]